MENKKHSFVLDRSAAHFKIVIYTVKMKKIIIWWDMGVGVSESSNLISVAYSRKFLLSQTKHISNSCLLNVSYIVLFLKTQKMRKKNSEISVFSAHDYAYGIWIVYRNNVRDKTHLIWLQTSHFLNIVCWELKQQILLYLFPFMSLKYTHEFFVAMKLKCVDVHSHQDMESI